MSFSSDGEEGSIPLEQQLDLIWIAAVSIGEQHGFVGDAGWFEPHADSEGGQGDGDIWYDRGVDSTGTHWEEEGHLTT